MKSKIVFSWLLKVLVGAVLDIAVAYFFVLWGLERLAVESGLEFYPDQTFVNACYLCAILWGIKAIK